MALGGMPETSYIMLRGSRHDLAQCPDCGAWRSAQGMSQHRTANHLRKLAAKKTSQRRDVTIAKVLARLAEGARRVEIARDLGCTLKTVNRRIEYFMMSTGARTREQMMAEAARRGILK